MKSTRELGAELGVTHRTVQKARRRGKSDEQIASEVNARAPRRLAMRRSDVPITDEEFAQAVRRKEVEAARKLELENLEREGKLVDAGEVEREWTGVMVQIRDMVLGLPVALAPMVSAMTDARDVEIFLRDRLRGELRKISALLDDPTSQAA